MRKYLLPFMTALIAALVIGATAAFAAFNLRPDWVCFNHCQESITADRSFFADTLILYAQDSQGAPVLIELDMNRKKVGEVFTHYYLVNVLYQGLRRSFQINSTADSPQIGAEQALTFFENIPAEDLSSRETVHFTLKLEGMEFDIQSQSLQGDFLVKNTQEYTKYVSEGQATIKINGRPSPARLALMKIYSTDYSKYLFFRGYDELKSLSQFFVLWDEAGNFYLLDKSQTERDFPEYKSHAWVLYKNHAGNHMKKSFTFDSQPMLQNDLPLTWTISIPGIENISMSLQRIAFINQQNSIGLVRGTVQNANQDLPIAGYFSYTHYQ